MPGLIIFDVYGTIIKSDNADGIIRPGLKELMDFYKQSLKVTCSDGRKEMVESDLESVGIYDWFDCHYSYEDTIIKNGRILKNLGKICEDCALPVSEAVFIGDNYVRRDWDSAREFGMTFVKVPQFRHKLPSDGDRFASEDHVIYDDLKNPFSFVSLIGKL